MAAGRAAGCICAFRVSCEQKKEIANNRVASTSFLLLLVLLLLLMLTKEARQPRASTKLSIVLVLSSCLSVCVFARSVCGARLVFALFGCWLKKQSIAFDQSDSWAARAIESNQEKAKNLAKSAAAAAEVVL